MSEVTQALFITDDSLLSIVAREMLENSGVKFTPTTIKGPELKPPAIIAREGDFNGIRGIRNFVRIVTNRPNID